SLFWKSTPKPKRTNARPAQQRRRKDIPMPFLDTPRHAISAHYWGKQPWRPPMSMSPRWQKALAGLPIRTRQLAYYLKYLHHDGGGNAISLGALPSAVKQRRLCALQDLGLIKFEPERLCIWVVSW